MIEDEVREAARELPPGEGLRQTCPFCAAKHEKSFSIRRDLVQSHKLFFKCFRGTCSQQGMVLDQAGVRLILHEPDRQPVVVASKPLPEYDRMSPKVAMRLNEQYGIHVMTMSRQGLRGDDELDTLYMPWLTVDGEQMGWAEKRFSHARKSHHDKCIPYPTRLSWPVVAVSYHHISQGVAIMVEDLLSAYKIGQLADQHGLPVYPIALLGADISQLDAYRVSECFPQVVVLLDYDQWPKGHVRVRHAFSATSAQAVATTLPQDPKDVPTDDLLEFLRRVPGMFA